MLFLLLPLRALMTLLEKLSVVNGVTVIPELLESELPVMTTLQFRLL
jgi:hypothetical protein